MGTLFQYSNDMRVVASVGDGLCLVGLIFVFDSHDVAYTINEMGTLGIAASKDGTMPLSTMPVMSCGLWTCGHNYKLATRYSWGTTQR